MKTSAIVDGTSHALYWVMKRITLFTILMLVATAGVASADRRGGHRSSHGGSSHARSSSHGGSSHSSYGSRSHGNSSHGNYSSVGRHRSSGHGYNTSGHGYSTSHGRGGHRPVYQHGGSYRFSNGTSHHYVQPHFNQRYHDHRYVPPTYVESFQPVDGYSWVNGGWRWSGYEWIWSPGYYVVAPGYGY